MRQNPGHASFGYGETALSYEPFDDRDPVPAYYALTSPPPPKSEVLRGSLQFDVAVIGGGFTGAATALHLAERGVKVCIIEAKEIGAGASSRAFGQIVPYLKPGHKKILDDFGPERGERLIRQIGEGPDYVFSLIERFGIACSARRNGLLFAAHSPAGQATLESRTKFWQGRGVRIDMHEADETAALVGSSFYKACSIDYRGGTINPLAYVRGIASAAAGLGVAIYTDSPVEKIERAGQRWQVSVKDGDVTADSVVIATNAHTTDRLWPGLRQSIMPVRGYQLVSAPLSANLRKSILPNGQPLTDTRRTNSGVRIHDDGRLHSSTLGPPFDIDGQPDVAKLNARIAAVYPQLGSMTWDYRWMGWIAVNQDHYPHLHELAPGVWTGLGYNGRGIAAATLMGRDIAQCIAGSPNDETTFSVEPLQRWWMSPLARSVGYAGISYYRFRDALDETLRNR